MENYRNLILDYIPYLSERGSYVQIVPRQWCSKEEEDVNERQIFCLGKLTPTTSNTVSSSSKGSRKIKLNWESWWKMKEPVYAFNEPRIKVRLERWMGTNVVRVCDPQYMQDLQGQIKKDHLERMKKRIKKREVEEVKRMTKLLLDGLLPVGKTPEILENHPFCRVTRETNAIIAEKRSKKKVRGEIEFYKTLKPKIQEAKNLMKKLKLEENNEEQETDKNIFQVKNFSNGEPNKESTEHLMLEREEYLKLKYENPMLKSLEGVQTVDTMYKVAEGIIGAKKSIKRSDRTKELTHTD